MVEGPHRHGHRQPVQRAVHREEALHRARAQRFQLVDGGRVGGHEGRRQLLGAEPDADLAEVAVADAPLPQPRPLGHDRPELLGGGVQVELRVPLGPRGPAHRAPGLGEVLEVVAPHVGDLALGAAAVADELGDDHADGRHQHQHAHDPHEGRHVRHEEEDDGGPHAQHGQELHEHALLLPAGQFGRGLQFQVLRGDFRRKRPRRAFDDDLAHPSIHPSIRTKTDGSPAPAPPRQVRLAASVTTRTPPGCPDGSRPRSGPAAPRVPECRTPYGARPAEPPRHRTGRRAGPARPTLPEPARKAPARKAPARKAPARKAPALTGGRRPQAAAGTAARGPTAGRQRLPPPDGPASSRPGGGPPAPTARRATTLRRPLGGAARQRADPTHTRRAPAALRPRARRSHPPCRGRCPPPGAGPGPPTRALTRPKAAAHGCPPDGCPPDGCPPGDRPSEERPPARTGHRTARKAAHQAPMSHRHHEVRGFPRAAERARVRRTSTAIADAPSAPAARPAPRTPPARR